MNPEKFILSIFLKFRLLLEAVANPIERTIWQKRVYVLLLGIALVSYPVLKSLFPMLSSFDTGLLTQSGVAIGVLAVFLIETILRGLNFSKKRKRDFEYVTISDRFFGVLAYLWPLSELTGLYLNNILDVFVERYPVITSWAMKYLKWYFNTPLAKYGILSYVFFALYFYGIGRNRTFKFYTRYHHVQCILLLAVCLFQGQVFNLLKQFPPFEPLIEPSAISLYFSVLCVFSYVIFTAILGVVSYIPLIHGAVIMHTGKRGSSDMGPLGPND
uniref:hypothetical protein n=1 Tax=Meringosphaera mediterranea TaxID=2837474 RepID=UPI00286D1B3B|nr:hypothetical protein RMF24_pgp090 [Meringosphaera mediterranea]WLD05699.1 hypothetical protein [Meringosphaera mediterranea]WLD05891.1 hypothetical protein [Meringosphaera mediterranea]